MAFPYCSLTQVLMALIIMLMMLSSKSQSPWTQSLCDKLHLVDLLTGLDFPQVQYNKNYKWW